MSTINTELLPTRGAGDDPNSLAIGDNSHPEQTLRSTNIGRDTGGSGFDNTALGYRASHDAFGKEQTSVGVQAGEFASGHDATHVGYRAGQRNVGANATSVGHSAGLANKGANATAFGTEAGAYNNGTSLTAVGYQAAHENRGNFATAVGAEAAKLNSGVGTTAVGFRTLTSATGGFCTAVGGYAGANTTGQKLAAFGAFAGEGASGTFVAVGAEAFRAGDGHGVVAVGAGAGKDASAATDGVFVGSGAGATATGENAIAIGRDALADATVATDCIAIGKGVLRDNAGERVIAIGATAAEKNAFNDVVLLGRDAVPTASNQIVLGGPTDRVLALGGTFQRADERDAANAEPEWLGLDFVNMLQPKVFEPEYRDEFVRYGWTTTDADIAFSANIGDTGNVLLNDGLVGTATLANVDGNAVWQFTSADPPLLYDNDVQDLDFEFEGQILNIVQPTNEETVIVDAPDGSRRQVRRRGIFAQDILRSIANVAYDANIAIDVQDGAFGEAIVMDYVQLLMPIVKSIQELDAHRLAQHQTFDVDVVDANVITTGELSVQDTVVGRGAGGVPSNTVVGNSSLSNNVSGDKIVAIGNDVLTASVIASKNTGVGSAALSVCTGNNNVAVGAEAMLVAGAANDNIAVGSAAMLSATTESSSTAVGAGALLSTTNASDNVAVGTLAAAYIVSAGQNTALGSQALSLTTTGSQNTTYTNCAGLGYDTRVSGSDQVQLGNSSTTPYAHAALQLRSDERDKTAIADEPLGLDFVNALRPRTFVYDFRDDYSNIVDGEAVTVPKDGSRARTRRHHGLVAQELKATCDAMGIDFAGLQHHAVNGGEDVWSVGYDELIAVLIRAVQELSAEVASLTS